MKVFIGFGYNPADKWIIDLEFPLVKAFGCEILTGFSHQIILGSSHICVLF